MSEQVDILPRHQYDAFLKQLPKDWEQKEIKQIGAVIGGSTPSRDVPSFWRGSIPWVTPGEVSGEGAKLLHDTNDHISASGLAGSGANLLPAGSLLVTTRATLGARVINAVPMTTNQGFKSVVFKKSEEASYYFHLFEKVKPELVRRASGTTFLEISGAEFGSIKVPSPSPNEKLKIAQIFDTFDTAIQETEAIIAKLKAVKQGLLHDLLTRGIDSNGELRPAVADAPHLYKESPLGWIPKEWDALRLREIADLQVGFAFKSHWFLDAGKTRLLRGDNVGYGFADWDVTKFLGESSVGSYIEYLLKAGDVIVGMDRTFTKTGAKFSVIKSDDLPCLLVQRVGRFVPKLCSMSFLRLLTMWPRFHRELLAQQKGMDIPHLSKNEILSPFVPMPTEREQALSSEKITSIEERLSFESSFMHKLKAQKSALMDDLLTGRVRVTPLLAHDEQKQRGE